MFYTEEFRERVKKAYPNSKFLNKMLDNNELGVGYFLREHSQPTVHIDEIFKAKSLEQVQQLAEVAKERSVLHKVWRDLYLNTL